MQNMAVETAQMGHALEAFVLFLFAYLFLNVVHGWSLNVRNIVPPLPPGP